METNKNLQKLYEQWKGITGNTQQEAAAWLTLAQIIYELSEVIKKGEGHGDKTKEL